MQQLPLGFHENVIFTLRTLYSRYGYCQYKMSKFEEYDLYARNKDFLISDSVITFTDLSGKLMALKPDVTLSIVKNSKDLPETTQKLYYNENVYRITKGSHSFKEIPQVGLECLGNIDDYCILEILTLAAESLRTISKNCVLDISHQRLLSGLLESIGLPLSCRDTALKYIGQKNLHELTALCQACNVDPAHIGVMQQAITVSGAPETVLPGLIALLSDITDTQPLEQLLNVVSAMDDPGLKSKLRFDFSVVDDIHYYNGIVFKGFIDGIPSSILSGGQYDKLMQKMHRKSGAIGFAVYMDLLGQLDRTVNTYDVDTVLLYEAGTELSAIRSQVNALTESGCSVMVQQTLPENLRYRQLLILRGNEVETLEYNA